MNAVILASALVVSTLHSASPFDATDWQWRCAIEGDLSPGQYVRIELGDDIIDACRADYADLRIVDDTGALAPYILDADLGRAPTRDAWREARILDATYVPGEFVRAVLDFKMPVEKDRLRLYVEAPDSCRRLTVEGSTDNRAWEILRDDAWLVHLDQTAAADGHDFTLPTNTFRFLRVSLSDEGDGTDRLRIERATAACVRELKNGDLAPIQLRLTAVKREEKAKETKYQLDAGFRNAPIVRIDMTFSDAHYHRSYELWGRNSTEEAIAPMSDPKLWSDTRETPWTFVRRGTLYRIENEQGIHVSDPIHDFYAPYRYLELRVQDGDSPSLKASATEIAAYRAPANLAFRAQAERTYCLYFGNEDAVAPDFDIEKALAVERLRAIPAAPLGVHVALSADPDARPWTERHAVPIWIALGTAVVVMLVLIVSGLKKAGTENIQ